MLRNEKNNLKLSLILGLALIFLFGCSNTGEDVAVEGSTNLTEDVQEGSAQNDGDITQEDVREFVLNHTNVVEIISISRNVNPDYQEEGPLYMVKGIDEKGRRTEVWLKDLVIYEFQLLK